jgi:hypothetical protein
LTVGPVSLLLVGAIGCGSGSGDNEAHLHAPELGQWAWDNWCRAATDLQVDYTIDAIDYNVLDGDGRVIEAHLYATPLFDGTLGYSAKKIDTYDGPRLMTRDWYGGAGTVLWRYAWTWDGNLVSAGITDGHQLNGPDGTTDVTAAWTYDEQSRLRQKREEYLEGTPAVLTQDFEYVDADDCYDVKTYRQTRSPMVNYRYAYTNRPDCQPTRVELDVDIDGDIDQAELYTYDATGHPTVVEGHAVSGGTMTLAERWRLEWVGDQVLWEEYFDESPSPQNWYRTDYVYDCPEGVPPPRLAPGKQPQRAIQVRRPSFFASGW